MTIEPGRERFLVTGALGCIGAWVVKTLIDEGATVVTFDKGADAKRLHLVMGADAASRVTMINGDITDLASVERALDDHDIGRVIHLAALQVPFARADPPLGALVNVVGTVNLFEAVKARQERMGPLVYAGSIAMYGPHDSDPVDGRLHEDARPHPANHYGVFKLANEGSAAVYAKDDGVASVGLRPMTIYGPGRDQGLTSDPSRAVLSAVLGRPFEIGFGGRILFQYAPDAARAFIAAARSDLDGARVYNLTGTVASVDEFIAAVERALPGAGALLSHTSSELGFPADIDAHSLAELGELPVTPLDEAISETIALFRQRLAEGQLEPSRHGLPEPA